MKKRLASFLSFTALLSGLAVSLVINNNVIEKVEGYTTTNLPKTIKLDDTEESEIRAYYGDLLDLDVSQRRGTNLLANLKPILKDGQNYFSYDSGDNVWKMYEITDRDWEKSPASSTTYGTYDSTTNTIYNYQYGSGKNNPYVHALYINRDLVNQTKAWGNHNQDDWGINREHVWAKSHGFDKAIDGDTAGARGDPMHLMAGNGWANHEHSNYFFGNVDKSRSYSDAGSKYSTVYGNLTGYPKAFPTSTQKVFEPQDSDKGDIARAIFYMVARYNNYSGHDDDEINSNNPNLVMLDDVSENTRTGSSTASDPYGMGILSDLLEWNRLDPPDEYEIHRNNLLYTNFTNNRNPFIDFPDWADYIWGDKSSSYAANPESDTLNGFGGDTPEVVSVESVSLTPTSKTIYEGDTFLLSQTITPSNATDKSVTWTTSNDKVATVSNKGLVTGVKAGTATITVTTHDGNKTATCAVTVEEEQVDPVETLTLTISYSDTFDPALPTASGSVNENATAHEDKTAKINIKEAGIYKGTSNSYLMFAENKGYLYNTQELGTIKSVKASYTTGVSEKAKAGVYFGSEEQSSYTTASNETISKSTGYDTWTNSTLGKGYFQLSSSNKNCQITTIEIKYRNEIKNLEITGQTTSITQYDDYEFDGTVTAYYYDGTSKDVTDEVEVSNIDADTYGVQEVTVSYSENGITKSDSFDLTVNEYRAVVSVEVSPATSTLDLNGDETVQLTADVETVGSAVSEEVTWTSSDTDVATVSSTGLVTAVSKGNATITATSVFNSNMSGQAAITVVDTSQTGDTVTDTLTRATTGVTSTSYGDWSGVSVASSAVYAGQSAGGSESIQLRSKPDSKTNKHAGIITTASGGKITQISVTWNESKGTNQKLYIYGNSTAYSSPDDLFDSDTDGTLLGSLTCGTSTSLSITGDYEYVGVRSYSGALYLLDISFTWEGSGVGPDPTPVDPDPAGPEYHAETQTEGSPYTNGVAYKMFFVSTYASQEGEYYFTGSMSGNYGATVKDSYSGGCYVYFENRTGGQNLYIKSGNDKKYISVTKKIDGTKTYYNFTIGEANAVPTNPWVYSEDCHCIVMNVEGTNYTLGTYDKYVTFGTFNPVAYPTNYKVQFAETAESYSYGILNHIHCVASGTSAPTYDDGYTWMSLYYQFESLDVSQQNLLKNKSAHEHGDIIQQALAKYDYIVNKYKYDNFLERNIPNNSSIGTISSSVSNNFIIIASLVGGLSILTLGLAILAKRKKEY